MHADNLNRDLLERLHENQEVYLKLALLVCKPLLSITPENDHVYSLIK